MGFNTFRLNVLIRSLLLGATVFAAVYLWHTAEKTVSAVLALFLFGVQLASLFHYLENTNRKLTRFLEHIKYADFTSGFASDNHLGKSFRQLNKSFNEVLDAFRQARAEKEEHFQYLNTVVQHVETGLVAFDKSGKVELMNSAAHRLLHCSQVRNIADFEEKAPALYSPLSSIEPGGRFLYRNTGMEELAVTATEIKLKGRPFILVSIHNIQAELQKKELEAWQNLTKVLRHEIMNSLAPISSLTSTLKDIVDEELSNRQAGEPISEETIEDIREALGTIERRSHALARFINAYKEFTHVPQPNFEVVPVQPMLKRIYQLMQGEIRNRGLDLVLEQSKNGPLTITADPELIEMVLINLLKNALQAVEGLEGGEVVIGSGLTDNLRVYIKVADNGPGIIPEAIERIFIPFYTTKKEGSGIGLALSRQIMQQHKGSLTVSSEPNVKTVFVLTF